MVDETEFDIMDADHESRISDGWTEGEIEQCWYCDWCSKMMKDDDNGVSDASNTMHCSQECADESNFNMT